MNTLEEIEGVLGPIPRGPLAGDGVTGGAPPVEVLDPATEEPLARVASVTVDEALTALGTADAAQRRWARTSPRERSDVLRRAFDLLTENAEAVARLIVLENGKALPDARAEVRYAAEFFRWYSEEAVRLAGTVQTAPSGQNTIMVLRQPIGVALLITPWNFPAAMATRKIGPALAAGCAVLLKPAAETPLTALAIAALLTRAGVPEGVVGVLCTQEPGALTTALLADPRLRKLSFTGSTRVGRLLLAEAARTVVSSSMELGGNAPFLVLADADLDEAVEGALVAKLRNGGSACTAANRMLVHSSVAEEFSGRLAAAMAALTVGPGLADGVRIGPLVNRATLDKVSSLVESSLAHGSRALTGGRPLDGPGYFYPPTVLAGVDRDDPILREEIFGPVAPVVAFDDLDDAVDLANDTEYGLVSYVYTRDLRNAVRVGERLETGMVGVNRAVVSDPAAPFGGVKQSGLGREGGHDGMLEYTECKYLALDWS
ncbi:NAD-dependent succinate-semialdehyde dehydrogenase [Streptomyces sp. NPDC005840]|uniref:NAD-dependent succinate-semialdehyde dehydrogenase n=1 Tax=Streptomyces doudnae TaxID=3075536 RepID=A0ABD5EN48_9ACTN|nr:MULTISPECIES: NAD-dependent succinate-semialdehyde dehydrogenase [unclassified Streptomyces]MDT0435708.1 NAD-dependent succinate-semialdehyde dehydrogenase [Streptomyces sp. DSM 41981]MYQ62661.1 aldehyde dehydrogenase family protein [Streptomyces sp. SID4950]SCD41551.1 succinate semialdehyde dehydrogenase [Streptomyces sp. SolWspMP-5a-2]